MNITLRIKRVYFDQILDGSKTIEYRDAKPFYDRIFKNKEQIRTLTLHYQRARKLICDVVAINRIKTPDWFFLSGEEDDDITFGDQTYAIVVRNARLV